MWLEGVPGGGAGAARGSPRLSATGTQRGTQQRWRGLCSGLGETRPPRPHHGLGRRRVRAQRRRAPGLAQLPGSLGKPHLPPPGRPWQGGPLWPRSHGFPGTCGRRAGTLRPGPHCGLTWGCHAPRLLRAISAQAGVPGPRGRWVGVQDGLQAACCPGPGVLAPACAAKVPGALPQPSTAGASFPASPAPPANL